MFLKTSGKDCSQVPACVANGLSNGVLAQVDRVFGYNQVLFPTFFRRQDGAVESAMKNLIIIAVAAFISLMTNVASAQGLLDTEECVRFGADGRATTA